MWLITMLKISKRCVHCVLQLCKRYAHNLSLYIEEWSFLEMLNFSCLKIYNIIWRDYLMTEKLLRELKYNGSRKHPQYGTHDYVFTKYISLFASFEPNHSGTFELAGYLIMLSVKDLACANRLGKKSNVSENAWHFTIELKNATVLFVSI